ncbi:NAD(P)-binding protein [Lepidopterella palustris CBS 459.81]|uniref:NAD(P)-binding protein n=1 Tax=Lepidopterella palustris CBS 459.81 TaxID=1314670 RepID=A0A8E2E3F7_9PEZI|nr:NAD(P)-binding protein [Lepidopterella palustris CBS 459.81]
MSTPIQVDQDSLKSLAGKTVLITGASSGIGLETAEFFYNLGCNVAFVCGRKRPLTKVPLDSPRTLTRNVDISSWDDLVNVFASTLTKFGQIDVVVANAGISEPRGQYFNLKVDDGGKPQPLELSVVDVDIKGTMYTAALGCHYMKGGSIVLVTSLAGYMGVPQMPNYSASKHAATGLLRSLAVPAAQNNIAVSLVAPHMTFTPGVFADKYQPGTEAFQKMRDALLPKGINLNRAYTCALAVGYLVHGGLKMAGKGLLIEGDEINDLEDDLNRALPAWFVAKANSKDAASKASE